MLRAFLLTLLLATPAFAAEADDLFDQLTSHEWTKTTSGKGFSHTVTMTFRRDGTYRWFSFSDYVERNDQGQWSFEATGKNAGVLHLSASGDVPFRIEKDSFGFFGIGLPRGEKIDYAKADLARTAKDLKPVPRTKEGERLTATAWVKTNPFDLYRLPERIEFTADQRYRATYRDKSCEHGGEWSLIQDHANRWDLDSRADDNACDQRGGSAGLSHWYLTFEGELLVLGDCYAPVGKKPERNIFLFDAYAGSVQTRGEFAGDFTAGKPLIIDFTHSASSEYTLKSFAVGLQKYKRGEKGSSPDGEMQWLAEKDLEGVKVSSGKPHSHRVTFKPPHAGEAAFQVRFKYSNASQPFEAQPIFFLMVK